MRNCACVHNSTGSARPGRSSLHVTGTLAVACAFDGRLIRRSCGFGVVAAGSGGAHRWADGQEARAAVIGTMGTSPPGDGRRPARRRRASLSRKLSPPLGAAVQARCTKFYGKRCARANTKPIGKSSGKSSGDGHRTYSAGARNLRRARVLSCPSLVVYFSWSFIST